MGKVIDFYKKKQNLILGLLIALFWIMLFMPTISIPESYGVTVKDFAIMRPVSIPSNDNVYKDVLNTVKGEIGESYSFDHMYNNVYVLFVFGLVALFMCFKKFNKGLLSKIVSLSYSAFALYSLLFTNNVAQMLKIFDTGYVAKVVVAALMFIVSLIAVVLIIAELAKNSWLKNVNVHIFLNSICSIIMLAAMSLMFMPFSFEGKTASIMGYLLLPDNYAIRQEPSTFAKVFEASIPDFNINTVIMIPLLLFVIGILASIFGAGYHKNIVVPVMSIIWAVLCIAGCFLSAIMAIDSKIVIYIVLSVALIIASVINLIQHHKANAIYR